jgi:adenylate cyclase
MGLMRPGEGGVRYCFLDCVLDTDLRELRRGANVVAVAPQVFSLITYLIRNRERVVSKDDLIAAVWDGRIVSEAALTTRINAVRRAIGDSGEEQRLIKTLPRIGFRFVGAVREEQVERADWTQESSVPYRPIPLLPDKPSIAILPFANLDADPNQDCIADGIVADIITELSRFGELFVIARNSSFQYKGKAVDVRQVGRELGVRYVLEGSVRRGGDRLRVSAQLIDSATGAHRWAERYDRKIEDVFAVQDEVVRKIVTILATQVGKAETERARAKPPSSWQAYDYYLQGADAHLSFRSSYSVEDLCEARRLLQRSLSIDPSYARSYALLADLQESAWISPLDGDFLNPDALDQAHQLARKAVGLDPNLPLAHAVLGLTLAFKRQHEAAIAEIERAIALNPNYVDWRLGLALVLAGHGRRAIDLIEAYMRLDPFYSSLASGILGLAHYMLEQYAQALPALRDCVSRSPNLRAGHNWLAATYARLDQLEEARAEVAEVLRIQPDYTISGTARPTMPFKSARDGEHLFEGQRMAGVPE